MSYPDSSISSSHPTHASPPSPGSSSKNDPASSTSNLSGPSSSSSSPSPSSPEHRRENFEEDPFHDEFADDADAEWVAKNLISNLRHGNTSKDKSDHVNDGGEYRLGCPCCFSLLCLQCQAHEEYEGQFRAVFVRNCKVVKDAAERILVNGEEKGKGKFQTVACRKCNTEVAVLDEEGVYHFCNVLY